MDYSSKKKEPAKILIVDDISVNLKILENIILNEGYEPLCALSVQRALDIMKENKPQLILSDFSMPGMNGLEFCKLLKENPVTRDIPFVFITVADSSEEKKAAFSAGAVDFIAKPFEPIEVVMRINNHLNSYRIKQEMEDYNRMMHRMVTEQKKQMEKERANMLMALANIAERRNSHIGNHLERVGYNSRLLAQSLQLVPRYEDSITDEFVETIEIAAKLHDIGNIVMTDEAILRYNQEIPKADWKDEMKNRTELSAGILEEIGSGNSRFMDMAIQIARYHYAYWDGSGYPEGIGGSSIPLAARIVAVVNDLDNLIRKKGYSLQQAVEEVDKGSGVLYDPGIVEVMNKIQKQFRVV
ncbi:MAG: response regulator [Acetatifactor sp.]